LADARLFHYGAYEARVLKRTALVRTQTNLCHIPDTPLTNVLSEIYSKIYFPTYSNSLKDIAHPTTVLSGHKKRFNRQFVNISSQRIIIRADDLHSVLPHPGRAAAPEHGGEAGSSRVPWPSGLD
jgi:hypothetical protein